MTNKILKESEDVREKVNATLLDVGKEFRGKTNVKHMVDVLYEGVGLERIEKSITNPFKGLKAAVQAGCHLVRPKILHYGVGRGFDDLDRLVKTLGIEVADYEGKEICCGGPLRDIEDNFARNLSRKKLAIFKKANVDCVVTVCPFCYMQFDMGQLEIKTMHKEEFNLPVVHFAELLSLAMGFQPSEMQLKEHKIPADHILLKHSGG
ncbi:MAG: heterodisulfide reductase-related iron-sulfur binding cluster [Candidatus Binatia bacterium]